MLRFSKGYAAATALLFITELVIALYVKDAIIRPYIGDLLVVVLLYCCIQAFFKAPKLATGIAVLLFSYIVEALQYLHFIYWLGLEDSLTARLILGTGFSWIDMVAYTLGFLLLLLIDRPKTLKQ